jgi:hypothetical protein
MRKSWAVGVVIPIVALAPGCPAAPAAPPSFTSQEQAFLRELQHDQIPVSDPLIAVGLGHNICDMLADGLSPTTAQNAVSKGAPDLEGVGANIVVDAAATYLCPEEEQGRPGLGLPPNMQHGYS